MWHKVTKHTTSFFFASNFLSWNASSQLWNRAEREPCSPFRQFCKWTLLGSRWELEAVADIWWSFAIYRYSESFPVNVRVQQRSVWSPFLFSIVIDQVSKRLRWFTREIADCRRLQRTWLAYRAGSPNPRPTACKALFESILGAARLGKRGLSLRLTKPSVRPAESAQLLFSRGGFRALLSRYLVSIFLFQNC